MTEEAFPPDGADTRYPDHKGKRYLRKPWYRSDPAIIAYSILIGVALWGIGMLVIKEFMI